MNRDYEQEVMKRKFTFLLVALLLVFTIVGINDLRKNYIKLQLDKHHLIDSTLELKKVQAEKEQLNKKFDEVLKNWDTDKIKQLEDEKKQLEEKTKQLEKDLQAKRDSKNNLAVVNVFDTANAAPVDNETIAWNFLIQKYPRHQVAGIMGNLRQEHSFQTSDVSGGLGIAQWLGNRRDNLIARGNYTSIDVQLQFMIDELNTTERAAETSLRASGSIEEATIAFQNKYERCGACMQSQRIQYAHDINSRH